MPKPLHHFIARILQKQNALNSTIDSPIINTRAVLLLSCPVDSVFNGADEAMIMSFFGAHWIYSPQGITGFFSTVEKAVQYARSCFAETRDITSPS